MLDRPIRWQLESLGKHKEAQALKQMISMTSLIHEENKKEPDAPVDNAEATARASQIEDARMLATKVNVPSSSSHDFWWAAGPSSRPASHYFFHSRMKTRTDPPSILTHSFVQRPQLRESGNLKKAEEIEVLLREYDHPEDSEQKKEPMPVQNRDAAGAGGLVVEEAMATAAKASRIEA